MNATFRVICDSDFYTYLWLWRIELFVTVTFGVICDSDFYTYLWLWLWRLELLWQWRLVLCVTVTFIVISDGEVYTCLHVNHMSWVSMQHDVLSKFCFNIIMHVTVVLPEVLKLSRRIFADVGTFRLSALFALPDCANICYFSGKVCVLFLWSSLTFQSFALYRLRVATVSLVGRNNVVDIAIRYGMDGPGIESRWGRAHWSRPALAPTQRPVQWVRSHFRVYRDLGVALITHLHLAPPFME